MSATGTEPSSAAAISGPQWYTSPVTSSMIEPTGTVSFSGEVMNTSAYRYSFQDSVNANTVEEKMPGSDSGSTIFHSTARRFAPSIRALSSMSCGMERKKPISSHVQNGMRNVGYVSTSAHRLSKRRRWKMMSASGMKRMIGGTRYVRKIETPSVPEPGNRRRWIAYAASRLTITEMSVETIATHVVFHSQEG